TTKQMADLGILAVKNPEFFDFKGPQAKNADGSLRPRHGFHTLPDDTLTPLHVIMAMIVAHDGTVYATTIYPFTLLLIQVGRERQVQTGATLANHTTARERSRKMYSTACLGCRSRT